MHIYLLNNFQEIVIENNDDKFLQYELILKIFIKISITISLNENMYH